MTEIVQALAAQGWVYVALLALAVVVFVGVVVFERDARRRRRRLEDRVAYRAFMQPKWDAARREVGL